MILGFKEGLGFPATHHACQKLGNPDTIVELQFEVEARELAGVIVVVFNTDSCTAVIQNGSNTTSTSQTAIVMSLPAHDKSRTKP